MHRFFGLLALAAAGTGLWLLFVPADTGQFSQDLFANVPQGYSSWALGLLMGLALALLASIDWRSLPGRFGEWLRVWRRRLALLMLGGLCAGVLLLF
jgi:hypothetical protein